MKCDCLILDGRHLLYRTSDAFSDLFVEVEGGRTWPTGGMYGFLSVSIRIHQLYGGRVVVAWEGDTRKNFRLGLYPEYKKRHQPIEDDDRIERIREMITQEDWLKCVLSSMGVNQYLGVNCEADDVIGRLATTIAKRGKRVFVYSGDSDLRQLVTEQEEGGIWTVSPGMRGKGDKIYGPEDVQERHDVPPSLISDLKALSGDSSDNIPGVKGIGPKTAATLLNHYESLDLVIEASCAVAEDWPVARRHMDAIRDAKEQLAVYHQLTRIKVDCEMSRIHAQRSQRDVVDFLKSFKFRSLSGFAELNQLMSMGSR